MTELKTLKDMEKEICYNQDKQTRVITHVERKKYLVADVEDLRAEAVKHVKYFEEWLQNSHRTSGYSEKYELPDDLFSFPKHMSKSELICLIKYIIYSSNLTEDDLK